jgi:hypothetical protein
MSDPLRSDAAADAAGLSERDRDARVEELLLSGLDHYFHGQHELAINIWTRVLFIDRGHARARAYIERARSAVAERQREGDELVHAATAAIGRGDAEDARQLLSAALERGAASDDTFALLDRLRRLETAHVDRGPVPRRHTAPVERRRGAVASEARAGRLAWIAAGAVLGMLAAAALIVWAGAGTWLLPAPAAPESAVRAEPPAVPVPTPASIVLERAREAYQRGRLREALAGLDAVPLGDPLRRQADDLKTSIQQQLLEARPSPAGATGREGAR